MQNMMSSSPRMADRRVLIVALVLGALAAGLAVAYLSSQSRPAVDQTALVSMVLVAEKDIPVGTKITDDMLAVRGLPVTAVTGDALRDDERARAVGQTARYPIARGEQVGTTRLVGAGQVSALSFQIPPGQRGFTITVDNESPVALLAPGDFVDVLLRGAAQDLVAPGLVAASLPPDSEVVVTLFQNVQVLAIGTTFIENGVTYDETTRGAPPRAAGAITVALTPEQAQTMYLARGNGEMTIALRRFGENQPAPLRPVSGPVAR